MSKLTREQAAEMAARAEPEQFPIARLKIEDDPDNPHGEIVTATLYAPGLPVGEHDVYCAAAPAPECKCDLRTKLVGDGCEVCNPKLAQELAAPDAAPPAFDAEEAMRLADEYARKRSADNDGEEVDLREARAALYAYLKGEK